jgi:hypothetical protein
VKVTWHNGKVECGKMFSKDSQSIIRIHNRNVKYLEDALRSNATVEVR